MFDLNPIDEAWFEKKFTIGLNSAIPVEQYESFLTKYKNALYSVYFSPPLGEKYSTRRLYTENLQTEAQLENFYNVLDCIRGLGIKLEMCLNVGKLTDADVDAAIEYMQMKVMPDEIVCMIMYYQQLREAFPECHFIYSFNNADPLENERFSKKFHEAAVGKKYLFSKARRDALIEKGIMPRLLLNNGCSYYCPGCSSSERCKALFRNSVEQKGLNLTYAEQSMWPFELHRLIREDASIERMKFKLSTRNKNLKAQELCLRSYLYGHDTKEYVLNNPTNYHLWCGLGHFGDYYSELDYDTIMEYKISRSWNWMDDQ